VGRGSVAIGQAYVPEGNGPPQLRLNGPIVTVFTGSSFVGSIAESRMEALGPDATLGVVADLLAELPRLEARIGHVTDVLGKAHPTSA
jgi:hypothetical protein